MSFDFEPTSPEPDRREPPGFWLSRALRRCADWIVYSPGAQPPDIQRVLLRQSLAKARTLVVSVVASSLMASVAVVMTAAVWAYVWLLAELVVGSFRIASTNAFVRAETSGRTGNSLAPIFGALVSFIIISAGGYHCVASGE
jgi:hypothetical protein